MYSRITSETNYLYEMVASWGNNYRYTWSSVVTIGLMLHIHAYICIYTCILHVLSSEVNIYTLEAMWSIYSHTSKMRISSLGCFFMFVIKKNEDILLLMISAIFLFLLICWNKTSLIFPSQRFLIRSTLHKHVHLHTCGAERIRKPLTWEDEFH